MNKVLIDNKIIFYFSHYCYKFKKLEYQEEIKKKFIKIKEQEQMVMADDDEEIFNEKISLQNDEHDNNIDLDGINQAR